MAKNRIFSGQDGRKDAIEYLHETNRRYITRWKKYANTAVKLADIKLPQVDENDTTKDIYEKARRISKILEKHESSVRKWKRLGRDYAKDANEEREKDLLKQRRGGSAEKLYAFIIDSLGGDRTPDDYPSDDVLEAADNLIQDGALITKQNLKDEIEAIQHGRDETRDEDVDSIIF